MKRKHNKQHNTSGVEWGNERMNPKPIKTLSLGAESYVLLGVTCSFAIDILLTSNVGSLSSLVCLDAPAVLPTRRLGVWAKFLVHDIKVTKIIFLAESLKKKKRKLSILLNLLFLSASSNSALLIKVCEKQTLATVSKGVGSRV